MSGIETIAIVAIISGSFGFLGYLGFLAHTNNSKNLKNDYLVIESRSDCLCKKEECCETSRMSDETENNRTVRRVVKINGIGKDLKSKEGQ